MISAFGSVCLRDKIRPGLEVGRVRSSDGARGGWRTSPRPEYRVLLLVVWCSGSASAVGTDVEGWDEHPELVIRFRRRLDREKICIERPDRVGLSPLTNYCHQIPCV